MSMRIWDQKHLTSLVVLLLGCGNGLTGKLGVSGDGGTAGESAPPGPLYPFVDPPSLGSYGQPCGGMGNNQPIMASFSPAGDLVALTVGPGHVEIHATSDGHLVAGFDAHFGRVTSLAFSPKEDLLATGGLDGTVKLWRGGVLLAQQQIFDRPVGTLAWSHDGTSLAVTRDRGPMALVRVSPNGLTTVWKQEGSFWQGPFFDASDAVLLAYDVTSNLWRAWHIVDGSEARSPIMSGDSSLFSGYVTAQSPNGSLIAYASQDIQIAVGRLALQQDTPTITILWGGASPFAAGRVFFTANGKRLALWGGPGSAFLGLYYSENGNKVGTLPWASHLTDMLALSNDNRWAVSLDVNGDGGAVWLVDLGSGDAVPLASQSHYSEVLFDPVTVSANGAIMLGATPSRSADEKTTILTVWNLSTRQPEGQVSWLNPGSLMWPKLSTQGDIVYGVTVIPTTDSDGESDGGYYRTLRVESLGPDGGSTSEIDYGLIAVSMANDERTLARLYSADQGYNIRITDRLTGTTKADFNVSRSRMGPQDILFSPDGTQIAVLRSKDVNTLEDVEPSEVSVWRVTDGQLLFETGSHPPNYETMAYSPDGATLVVVGQGGEYAGIDVYDAHRGTWLRSLDRTKGSRSVTFSSDGRYLVAASYGDGIGVWRTEDWQRYQTFGVTEGMGAVFLPQNQGVLETATGVIWCAP